MNSGRVNRNYYSDSGRSWGISVSEKQARYGCLSLSGQNASNGWWGQIPLRTRSQIISVLLLRCLTRRPRICGNLLLNPRTRSMGRVHFVIFACLLSDGGDITRVIAFREFLCTPSFAATSDWVRHSSVFLEECEVGTTCKIFAQDDDLPGTVAGPCRRRNSGTGAKDDRKATTGLSPGQTSNWA